jgi:hypothetical protein
VLTKHRAMSLTTGGVHTGTRQVVSLHWRNAAEDKTGMIKICVMSSMVEKHTARSKTDVRSMNALNRSSMKKRTMTTMVLIMTNLTDSVLPKGAQCRKSQGFFPRLEEGSLAPELQTIGD